MFDSMYQDGAALTAWARRRLAREIASPGPLPPAARVLYNPRSGTETHSVAVADSFCRMLAAPAAARFKAFFQVDRTEVGHNVIPRAFGWRLLADAGAALPNTTSHACVSGAAREAQSFGGEADAYAADAGALAAEELAWLDLEQPSEAEMFGPADGEALNPWAAGASRGEDEAQSQDEDAAWFEDEADGAREEEDTECEDEAHDTHAHGEDFAAFGGDFGTRSQHEWAEHETVADGGFSELGEDEAGFTEADTEDGFAEADEALAYGQALEAEDEDAAGAAWREDEADLPERFGEFEDARDAEWPSENGGEAGREAGDAEGEAGWTEAGETEVGLAGSGLTPAERKAVEITSTFETGRRGGFYGLSGNFDGQGLSFGLVNWTIGTGSLQPLLRAFAAEAPREWAAIFGPHAESLRALMEGKTKADLKAQHHFAITQMNSVTLVRGRKRWAIREPWVGYFRRLSESSTFRRIQVRFVRDLLARADHYCRMFGLRSERAFAFMFDAVSSHGKWWLDKTFKGGVRKRRNLLTPRLMALEALYGRGRVPEAKILEEIAGVLAATSAARWAEKVRVRKLWFLTGRHPRARELVGLQPSPDIPYRVGPARETAGSAEREAGESFELQSPAAASGPKRFFRVTVGGFAAGETDLARLIARRPATGREPILQGLIEAAFEAEHENPTGAKHCALLFYGHSDRDDTAGRPPEARRKLESQRAFARAREAAQWLLTRVNARARASGKPERETWRAFRHVSVFMASAGASELQRPPRSDVDRAVNRRVVVGVQGFEVDAITRRHEQTVVLSE
jgi:hypothetical protein